MGTNFVPNYVVRTKLQSYFLMHYSDDEKEGGRENSEFDQGTMVCLIICYMFDIVIGKGLLKLNVT